MDKNFILIVVATLIALFFLFGFNDCKSCYSSNVVKGSKSSDNSCKIEGFCTCGSSSIQSQPNKPAHFGLGAWEINYGQPYTYNEMKFLNL